jgi:Uma2 family endonuclease
MSEMLFLLNRQAGLERRPDVAFVSYRRWPASRKIPKQAAWDVVPDLAIEVVSPTNTASGVIGKVGEYFRAGVDRVWIVYPREAEVHIREAGKKEVLIRELGDTFEGGAILPGFSIPVGKLLQVEELSEDGNGTP